MSDLTSKEALDALEEELHAWGSVISRDQKAADTIQALRAKVREQEADLETLGTTFAQVSRELQEARTVTREHVNTVWKRMVRDDFDMSIGPVNQEDIEKIAAYVAKDFGLSITDSEPDPTTPEGAEWGSVKQAWNEAMLTESEGRECGCRRVWRDMTDSGYVCEKMGNRIMDFRCIIKGGEDE